MSASHCLSHRPTLTIVNTQCSRKLNILEFFVLLSLQLFIYSSVSEQLTQSGPLVPPWNKLYPLGIAVLVLATQNLAQNFHFFKCVGVKEGDLTRARKVPHPDRLHCGSMTSVKNMEPSDAFQRNILRPFNTSFCTLMEVNRF